MKHHVEKRAEEVLRSFDSIKPAAVPPFFYRRLIARMENELLKKAGPIFLLRPAFLTASLTFLLIFNVIFLFQFRAQQKPAPSGSTNAATIETFADAYNLNTITVYE